MPDILEKTKYMVSVCMTSYYHEPFISKAFDSILTQKTNFPVEIVICDDCSKDKTQEIIKSYADRYPQIRYKFNETNYGLTKNVFQAKCLCTGKYIVQLSGDDYWIDKNKLQKQVDFLEAHSEYIGIATRIESRLEDSTSADFIVPSLRWCNKKFTLADFLNGTNFPTNGFLMRNLIREKIDHFSIMPKMSPYIDDETDCILILMLGDIIIMNQPTVAYRRRIEKEGEHNFNSINKGIDKFEKHILLLNNLYNQFGDKIDLFGRYKVALGPEILKHYRKKTARRFSEIINTIPKEYRNRGLIIRSFFYNFPKAYEVLTRSHRR